MWVVWTYQVMVNLHGWKATFWGKDKKWQQHKQGYQEIMCVMKRFQTQTVR